MEIENSVRAGILMPFISHLKKLDWTLLVCVSLLCAISLLTLYSATYAEQESFFNKQLLFVIAGSFLMIGLSFFDYRIFKNNSFLSLILFGVGLLILGAVFIFGKEIRGSLSWFYFGRFSFQPIEFVKLVIIIVLAKYFSLRHVELYQMRHIIISGIYVIIPTILVMLQPDLGSAFILLFIWLGIILIAGIRRFHFFLLMLTGSLLAVAGWFFLLKDYQKERILTFLDPNLDPLGGGYSRIQSLIAIGSGGFWGRGLGHGTQGQLGFLPENHTDFMLASFSEEWGFLGVIFLFIIFSVIFYRLTKNSLESRNNFAKFFITGVTIMLISQLVINAGMNMGLLPITGIPFPFLSYGGSSLITIFIALGIVQSIRTRSIWN